MTPTGVEVFKNWAFKSPFELIKDEISDYRKFAKGACKITKVSQANQKLLII